jgi:hypothetical protein
MPAHHGAGVLAGVLALSRIGAVVESVDELADASRGGDERLPVGGVEAHVPAQVFGRRAAQPEPVQVGGEIVEAFWRDPGHVSGDGVKALLAQLQQVGAEESHRLGVGLVVGAEPPDQVDDLLGRPERRRHLGDQGHWVAFAGGHVPIDCQPGGEVVLERHGAEAGVLDEELHDAQLHHELFV